MKRKTLRNNQASPTTKKNKRQHERLERANHPKLTVESQVLTWDGILAAMTFAVPFVVGIAINIQVSVAITAVLAMVLIPASLLVWCLREKFDLPAWLAVPTCALVSAGITAFAAVYIRSNNPQLNDTLGMYLHLLAAYPVVGAVFHGKRARTMSITVSWALRNIIYFGAFTCTAGLVRELLAYNRFAGIELDIGFRLEAAKMPFFGFIVFAFLLAGVAAIYRLVSGRILAASTSDDEDYGGMEFEVHEPAKILVQDEIPDAPQVKEGEDADGTV